MWKARECNIELNDADSVVDKILNIRGIIDKDKFLKPSMNDVHSPFELSNMNTAVNKIIDGIKNNKVFGVYGDTDTDGITSLTEMVRYLEDFEIQPYILWHQRKDGHGVIIENVPENIDILIIVDSSSNSIDECMELSDKGIDVIILDHHIGTDNQYATIVNPQYNDYHNKNLSGAGVVYQTCKAIDSIMNTNYADKYLDICAVGLIGDMMDLSNLETRALVYYGLKKMRKNCYPQLMYILKKLNKSYKPKASDISFYVVPFINSIIRLGKIEKIINIMLCDDEKECKKLIKQCLDLNDKRKIIQADLLEKLEIDIDNSHSILIVVTHEENSNLNGLVANNLAQKYQKPTLVVKENDGLLCGSGRGYDNKIDFRKVLIDSDLFTLLEGHENSFGVEFNKENLNKIYDYCDKVLGVGVAERIIEYDLELTEDEITWDLLKELEPLYFITGNGFKEPTFLVKDLSVNDSKIMKDIHIKLNTNDLECVKFNLSEDEINEITNSLLFDGIGTLTINSWYNFGTKKTVQTKQMKLDDIIVY